MVFSAIGFQSGSCAARYGNLLNKSRILALIAHNSSLFPSSRSIVLSCPRVTVPSCRRSSVLSLFSILIIILGKACILRSMKGLCLMQYYQMERYGIWYLYPRVHTRGYHDVAPSGAWIRVY